MIKQSINQKNITIINIYALNITAPKYIEQILTVVKREIRNNTIKVTNVWQLDNLLNNRSEKKSKGKPKDISNENR